MQAVLLAALVAFSPGQQDYRSRFPLPELTIPDGWGVNLNLRDADEKEYDLMKQLGVRWARLDLHWSRVEQKKGVYDFSKYDPVVDGLAKRGIRMILILDYGNKVHDVDSPRTREGRAAFAEYARASVKRYKGRGVLWEIWNEPNVKRYWRSDPSADEYAALVKVVGAAIREIGTQEWIIGPATSRFDWPFLERTFQEGALEVFDAVSVHPYRDSRPPETVSDEWRRLRSLVDQYRPSGKHLPLISGEWGYPEQSKWVTPERQAQYAIRQYLWNVANGVPISIWFSWKDRSDVSPEEGKTHGLVRENKKPKAAFDALQSILSKLNGFRFESRVDLGSDTAHALLFQKGTERKLAVWTSGLKESDARLPVSVGSFSVDGSRIRNRRIRLTPSVQVLIQRP